MNSHPRYIFFNHCFIVSSSVIIIVIDMKANVMDKDIRILRKYIKETATQPVINKKRIFQFFPKITWKTLYKSLIFNKVAGSRPLILLQRDSRAGVSLWILQILENMNIVKHLQRASSNTFYTYINYEAPGNFESINNATF